MIGQNLRVLSNSAKVSAARPLLTAYSFFGHNGVYYRIVDRAGGSSWQSYRIIIAFRQNYFGGLLQLLDNMFNAAEIILNNFSG